MAAIVPRRKRIAVRLVRAALLRYIRAAPGPDELRGADRRVFILLWKAWEMGGTIRAARSDLGGLAVTISLPAGPARSQPRAAGA